MAEKGTILHLLELILVILSVLFPEIESEVVCGKLQKSQVEKLSIFAGVVNQKHFMSLVTENKQFEAKEPVPLHITANLKSRDTCEEMIQQLKIKVQFVSRIVISITNVDKTDELITLTEIHNPNPQEYKEVKLTFEPGVWWVTVNLFPMVKNPKKIVISKYKLMLCVQAPCLKKPIDVAIIGAGASGLFTAWQLSQKHPKWKIHVFDAADRIGGRIESATIPGITDFKAELGAGWIQPKHNLLLSVADKLGLTILPYLSPSADETMYYLRQKLLSKEDILTGKVPYDLTPEERKRAFGKYNIDLHSYWNEKILANNTTDDPWKRKCKDGLYAYQKGTYNAFLEETSQDAIEFAAYNFLFTYWYFDNANYADNSNIVPFIDEGLDVTPKPSLLYRVKEGMDEIPKRMLHSFLSDEKRKREILTNHLLMSIKYINNVAVLRFKDTSQQTIKEVCAKRVIAAVPAEALKRINFEDKGISNVLASLLPAVTPVPAAKIYLAYDRPWWRTDGRRSAFRQLRKKGLGLKLIGTDLPLGHIQDAGVDNKTGNALLMAYVDWWRNVQFWRDIISSNGTDTQEYITRLINKMLSKIFNIENMEKLPQPFHVVSKAWVGAPYWLAWHSKAPGYIYPDVAEKIKKPIKNKNFYVMGEAFGEYHGYIESALRSADEILHEYFNVKYDL